MVPLVPSLLNVRVKQHHEHHVGMVSRGTPGITVLPWVGVSHKLVNPWVGASHNQVVIGGDAPQSFVVVAPLLGS